jgi:DNA-binding transcriptional MerR regulator
MSDKVWFKIGETAAIVGATPKELRYWEKVIPDLRPRRSKGNLRYYHQEELGRLKRIHQWLAEGFTVVDCCELLRGLPVVSRVQTERPVAAPSGLQAALDALRSLHRRLGGAPGQAAPVETSPNPLPGPARRARTRTVKPPPIEPPLPAAVPLMEPEATSESTAPAPPRRSRKRKGETSALGRMWSEGRLPLDWEE